MNYYEHHLGDWAEATAHLTIIEDGAYSRMVRKYYALERPLPADCKELFRIIGCRSYQERTVAQRILDEFFELREDGWHNARCDEEIARFKAKSESAKASANASWNHANASNPHMRTDSERNANASNPHAIRNALQSPVSSNQINPTQTLPAEREGLTLREQGLNRRALGINPRAAGTSPRATASNPRSLGTNPRADRDERKTARQEAEAIWSELIATQGKRRDHRIQSALDAIGGWQAVKMRTEFESPKLQRAFCEAYLRHAPEGNGKDLQNGQHGPLSDWDEREEAARADL